MHEPDDCAPLGLPRVALQELPPALIVIEPVGAVEPPPAVTVTVTSTDCPKTLVAVFVALLLPAGLTTVTAVVVSIDGWATFENSDVLLMLHWVALCRHVTPGTVSQNG